MKVPSIPNSQIAKAEPSQLGPGPSLVNAETIGTQYGVTGRYILQLAAEGKIPCLRLGRKCVRFDRAAVAKALGVGLPDFKRLTKHSN